MIADIGYKTTDVVSMENGRYIEISSDQINTGVSQVHQEVLRLIMEKFNIKKELKEIDKIVRTKELFYSTKTYDMKPIIKEASEPFAENIIETLYTINNGELGNVSMILLTGGGAEIVYEYIRERGFFPKQYLTTFQTNRIDFEFFGGTRNVNSTRAGMILAYLIICGVLVQQILLHMKEVFKEFKKNNNIMKCNIINITMSKKTGELTIFLQSDKKIQTGEVLEFKIYLQDKFKVSKAIINIEYIGKKNENNKDKTENKDTSDEIKADTIWVIDGSDHSIAESVADNMKAQGVTISELDSIQSVTRSEIESGTTYLSIMEKNYGSLYTALKGAK